MMGKWPFWPGEFLKRLDKDLLRFVLTSLCESIPSPVVLFVKDNGKIKPVYPAIDKLRLYPEVCKFLDKYCQGECQKDNIKRAEEFWRDNKDEGKTECHLGFTVYSRKIRLYGSCVAICTAGKFIEDEAQREKVKEKLSRLVSSNCCPSPPQEVFDSFEELKQVSFEKFRKKFEEPLTILQDFIDYYTLEYRKDKERGLQNQISSKIFSIKSEVIENAGDLKTSLRDILKELKEFLGLSYIALFLSDNPEDQVLELFIQEGLSQGPLRVHFNWLKADLAVSGFDVYSRFKKDYKAYRQELDRLYDKGFKGYDRDLFQEMSYALPVSLNLKGLLVLGPFNNNNPLKSLKIEEIFKERGLQEFLFNICFFIISHTKSGTSLTRLNKFAVKIFKEVPMGGRFGKYGYAKRTKGYGNS
jgi:hypothetical protein